MGDNAPERGPIPKGKAASLVVTLLAALIVVVLVLAFFSGDTIWRRKRIVAELQKATENVKAGKDIEASMSKLRNSARSKNSFERTSAIVLLGSLGPRGAEAMEEFLEALRSDNQFAAREAARSVGELGVLGAPAVPDLIEWVKRPGIDVSWFAAESLGKIGEPALSAIPALCEAQKSDDPLLRDSAKAALGKLLAVEDSEEIRRIRAALLELCDSNSLIGLAFRTVTETSRGVTGRTEMIIGPWIIKNPEMIFTATTYRPGKVVSVTCSGRLTKKDRGFRAEVDEVSEERH